jgi:hypothetical protein
MDHALHQHAHVGILETIDADAAPVAVGKEGEGVARDLVEQRVAVAAEKWHEGRQVVARI